MRVSAALTIVMACLLSQTSAVGIRAQSAVGPEPLEQVIPALLAQAEASDAGRVGAVTALGYIAFNSHPIFITPPQRIDAEELASFRQSLEAQRTQEARRLGQLRPAIDPLTRLAADADPAMRREAAWTLGEIGGAAQGAAGILTALAGDAAQPDAVRETALIALARVEGPVALPEIERVVNSGPLKLGLVWASIFSWQEIGAPALAPLRAQLADAQWPRRAWALDALKRLGLEASSEAGAVGRLLDSDPEPRVRMAAIRALVAIAPDATAPLEAAVADPRSSMRVCQEAGSALERRPRAVAFDGKRCQGHPVTASSYMPSAAEQQALIAAAAGTTPRGPLKVTSSTRVIVNGEYDSFTQAIVVGCVEDTVATAAAQARTITFETRVWPRAPLRVAAIRVAGDGEILDAVGGTVPTDAPLSTCRELSSAAMTDATRWPIVSLKYHAIHPQPTSVTTVEWNGGLDLASRRWKFRLPGQIARVRQDHTVFGDEMRTVPMDDGSYRLAARWAGLDEPFTPEPVGAELRYKLPGADSLSYRAGSLVVPSAAVVTAPWLDIVMYGMDFGGGSRGAPAPPPGTPIVTLVGALIVPPEPADAAGKRRFWRTQLRHPHLWVRMYAAAALAQLDDRASLPDIVKILTAPTDLAAQVAPSIIHFGADAAPLVGPLLRDRREHVSQAAAFVLRGLGAAAVPIVRDALTADDATRERALKLLADMQPPQAAGMIADLVPLVAECEDRQHLMVCFNLLDALRSAGAGAAPARPALERAVSAGWDPLVRVRAASALFAAGGREIAIAALTTEAMTGRTDADSAARALVSAIHDEAVPTLAQMLQRRDSDNAASTAASLLAELGERATPALPAIATLMHDGDPATRRRTVPALRGIRTPESVRLLGEAIRDPDAPTAAAAMALLQQRGVAAVTWLVPILETPGDARHANIAAFVGRLGPPAATADARVLPALDRLAASAPESIVRQNAARAAASLRGGK